MWHHYHQNFYGSDCGIEVELNQKLLIYKNDLEQSRQWIQQELFNTASKSNIVATWNHNDSCNFLETVNVNQHGGNVHSLTKQQETFSKKQGSKVGEEDLQTSISTSWKQQETRALVAGDEPEFKAKINFYTVQAWKFSKLILYPNIHSFRIKKTRNYGICCYTAERYDYCQW